MSEIEYDSLHNGDTVKVKATGEKIIIRYVYPENFHPRYFTKSGQGYDPNELEEIIPCRKPTASRQS